jgi:hypothetical protein
VLGQSCRIDGVTGAVGFERGSPALRACGVGLIGALGVVPGRTVMPRVAQVLREALPAADVRERGEQLPTRVVGVGSRLSGRYAGGKPVSDAGQWNGA